MELIRRSPVDRMKRLLAKIEEDNLFLLSSSTSYYAALAIAPFLMILLGVAGLIGANVQHQIAEQASKTMSPEVGNMITMIFKNVNEGVSFGTISGIIGIIILLSTASMVFLQLRFSFDVIYGYFHPEFKKTTWQTIKERLFAMFVVIMAGVFFIFSFSIAAVVTKSFGKEESQAFAFLVIFLINFFIYLVMFMGIHTFTPSKRPLIGDTFKISIFSSIFFMLGNVILASYLKKVAANSIYGAAGTLLVFLVWSYYNAFTMFLSVEVFLYLKKIKKIR